MVEEKKEKKVTGPFPSRSNFCAQYIRAFRASDTWSADGRFSPPSSFPSSSLYLDLNSNHVEFSQPFSSTIFPINFNFLSFQNFLLERFKEWL